MKVFLTGGSGYIGRTVITALFHSDRGATIVSLLGSSPVAGTLDDAEVLRRAPTMQDGIGAAPYVHTNPVDELARQ